MLKAVRDFIGRIFNKNTSPITYSAETEGLIYNHNDQEIRAHIGGADRELITDTGIDTFENKTIDADNNTILNLEVDNLKAGVLDTDLSTVSALDDTIPSAKATRAAIDLVQDDVDDLVTLSGVPVNSVDLGMFDETIIPDNQTVKQALQSLETYIADNVQAALDGKVDEVGGTLSAGSVTDSIVDFNTATNTSKLVLPQDSKANLDLLTREEGRLYYANDEDSVYFDNGTELIPVGAGSAIRVSQTGHGFVALDAIYHNGTTWVKAIASAFNTSATHIVSAVPNANTFVAVQFARITVPAHGKSIGAYYYVSQTVAGATTTDKPLSGIENLAYKVEDANTIQVQVRRGFVAAKNELNYIANSDIEDRIEGYVAYADAAGVAPVDGIGGTPNVTIARNTTTPLRGLADALFTKDSINRQGQGFAYDFSIDNADLAQILRITFDYKTSANYVDGDMRVYIYDVTNATVIELPQRDLAATTLGSYMTSFQTSSNSTSYRLIFHVASTSALAYTVNVDNVRVGKQSIVKGLAGSNAIDFTPTITGFGTVTNAFGQITRLGDKARVSIGFTSGIPTGVPASVTLPFGLTYKTNSGSEINCGTWIRGVTNEISQGMMIRTASGSGVVFFGNATNQSAAGISPINAATATNIAANGNIFQIEFEVTINGWDSNLRLSEDTGNRLIVARAFRTGSQSITDVNQNTVILNTIGVDTASIINTTTGQITIPETGYYHISAQVTTVNLATPDSFSLRLIKNGATEVHRTINTIARTDVAQYITINRDELLIKGDVLTITVDSETDASYAVAGGDNLTYFSLHKIVSPQTLAGSESVIAVYSTNAGQAVTNGNTIIFEDRQLDTHGAYNASTGVFTAPQTGNYLVTYNVTANSVAGIVNAVMQCNIALNNVANTYRSSIHNQDSTNNQVPNCIFSRVIPLNKGDFFDVRFNENIGAVNLQADGSFNYISIVKVG